MTATVYRRHRSIGRRHIFIMTLRFTEEPPTETESHEKPANSVSQIGVHVAVTLERPARASGALTDRARQLITSLQAYLMANKAKSQGQDDEGQQSKKILLPQWMAQ